MVTEVVFKFGGPTITVYRCNEEVRLLVEQKGSQAVRIDLSHPSQLARLADDLRAVAQLYEAHERAGISVVSSGQSGDGR